MSSNSEQKSQASVLKTEGLVVSFGESTILNGVNFEANCGERVGIIGPNGSGKTTFFNCLSGFNRHQSGTIKLFGEDVSNYRPPARANLGLGRLFQNFGVFREMTVEENIVVALESKEGALVFPWSRKHKQNLNKAKELLESVGLSSKRKDRAGSLSGGQLRLLEIIRLIAFEAKLLLLDEPTAGVSPKMKGEIQSSLARLQASDTTILIIEHDMNFLSEMCDRFIVLNEGKIALDDTPEKIRQDERLTDIYFGNSKQA